MSPPTPGEPITEATRATMKANRRRDTTPELAVRRILHGAGLRFRVDHPLPFDRRKRADIVFSRAGLYVFIDGCFWHGCPDHFVLPKTRTDFWHEKIARNRNRDLSTNAGLIAADLVPLRIWEHTPPAAAATLIVSAYRSLRR